MNDEKPPHHFGDEWIMVGRSSADTLLVRGGLKPIAIRVNHGDAEDLRQLLRDANAGIAAQKQENDARRSG